MSVLSSPARNDFCLVHHEAGWWRGTSFTGRPPRSSWSAGGSASIPSRARRTLLAVVAVAVIPLCEPAMSADLALPPAETIDAAAFDDRWSVAAGAYVWAAALSGSVGVGGVGPADIDASFGDIIGNLDFALMAVAEARYGRFGVFADLVYTRLSADGSGPRGRLDASATNELVVGTLMGEFRAAETGKTSLDILAGARLWNVSGSLTLTGPLGRVTRGDVSETWVDPMIGAKGRLQGASPWSISGWGMVGGFGVSSDIAWDALGGVGYEVTDRISVFAGYRALGVDYSNDGFVFDVVQHGPALSGIKSAKDNLDRLALQIDIYRQTLQKLTLIAAPKHIEGIVARAPEWCSVISAEQGRRGGISFQVFRKAATNPEIDPVMMAHLLWRDEVIKLLDRAGYAPKDLRRPRKQLYEMLCEAMTLPEITASIRSFMVQRRTWRDHPAHA